jgi:leucyl aminopeptidase
MNVTVRRGNILETSCDIAVFGVFLGTQEWSGTLREEDKALGGLMLGSAADEDFAGKTGETLSVHTHGKLPCGRVLIVGLGDKERFGAESARRAAAAAVRFAAKTGAKDIALELFPGSLGAHEMAQAVTEGALLADYGYLAFKPQEAKRLLKRGVITLSIIEDDATRARAAEKGIAIGEVMSRATIYARDLVNEPAGRMTPTHLLEHARRIVANNSDTKLKAMDRDACVKLGMGAFLAVAAGSDEDPHFMHLIYRPKGGAKRMKKIVLVGKGITFDSGGLSLKPSEAMETMKGDMAGAAAVLGVFSVLDDLGIQAEVHGLIAACENMPSGKAMRVGDIVTAMNGKSIEILNTDAEGRLALADSLSYSDKKIKPDFTVDIATLTGACMAALGPDIAGLMGTDDTLLAKLEEAARVSGEDVWRLPLPDDYSSFVVGEHSDLRNTSRVRWGGAITAGLFLKQFAGSPSWAHIDIAGPSFAEREAVPYAKKGGTGFGVRLLLGWLRSF